LLRVTELDATANTDRRAAGWHLLVIFLVSVGFESLFVHHGINLTDEGLALYPAMQLHDGGTLYRDAVFVFPPGHLLSAWIAYALDPPGVVLSRIFYAAFNVALCLALYALGRRIMPARFAFFGALLVAITAFSSHTKHLLFGYRYLVFSTLALVVFARRLRTGDARHLWLAGILTGIAVCFRLTPAFAVSCGIAAGILASSRSWRVWISDGLRFGGGLLAVAAPVYLWFGLDVGFETLWREVVVRPVVMTELQQLPLPQFSIPKDFADRRQLTRAFVPVFFWIGVLVYVGHALFLSRAMLRSLIARKPFQLALLTAVVVWGGVYFTRSLGRSDAPHIDSAFPPVCLLLVHGLWIGTRRAIRTRHWSAIRVRRMEAVGAVLLAGLWVVGFEGYRVVRSEFWEKGPPAAAYGATSSGPRSVWKNIDPRVEEIRRWTGPDDRILDMTASPLIYVLSQRRGPGYFDMIMPGTFLNREEELAFLSLLQADPPALVIWPPLPFDRRPDRAVQVVAPVVSRWVLRNYRPTRARGKLTLLLPVGSPYLNDAQ
jgi:hypothetical protein